jgi:hypothetical protein
VKCARDTGIDMDKSNKVQTIVRADLTAYIYKSRLEKLLQEMFGEIIKVNVSKVPLRKPYDFRCSYNRLFSIRLIGSSSLRLAR